MADENIVIGVDLKDDFTGPARRVVKSLDDMGDQAFDAAARFRDLDEDISDVGRESTKTSLKARLAASSIKKMGREALKAAGEMRVLSAAMSRLDRFSGSGGGGGGAGVRGGGNGDITGKVVKAGFQFRGLRIAGILAAIASIIPAAVAGVASLGAAVMGLVGALAPLTGLIVAYPGYLAAFGQAFATVKLAFSGLGEAIEVAMDPAATAQELRAAYSKFGTSLGKEFTSQFVRNLAVAKREIDGFKGAIQQALLPAVNNLVNAARTLFPTIATGLASTGAAIGGVINQFAQTIQSGAFTQELSQIMGTNVQIISNFGGAALSGFRALMDILVAAGPLLIRISSDVSQLFQTLSSNVAISSAGGGLASFFERTYEVARQLVQIFWDVGVALKNIATIGQPLGQAILDSFSGIAEAFRSFTESGEGVNQIRQWFIDMTPVIYEIGFLIRDVAAALMGLSNPTQFLQISMALRQELLPVLVSVIEHFSQMLPSIIQIITAALQMFNAFQQMAPLEVVFSGFATVLTVIARAITAIASGPLSGIGTAIMFLVGAAVGVKVLAAAFLFLARAIVGSAIVAAVRGLIFAIREFGVASTATAAQVRVLGAAIKSALISTGIGAVLVVIGLTIEAIMNMNAAVDEQIAANEAWAQSLFDVNGAMNETARATTANSIAGKDYIGTLENMGIQTADVVDAVMGSDQAFNALIARLTEAEGAKVKYIKRGNATIAVHGEEAQGIRTIIDDLTGMRTAYVDAEAQANRVSTALGENTNAMDELSLATQSATNQLQKLNGWLDILGSNASWRQSIMSLKDALDEGTSFKKWTEEGEKNLAALRDAVDQSLEKVQTLYEGGNVKGAERVLQKRIGILKDIMLSLPKEDRKPFQQMLERLQTQRRRFDRQIQAMIANPVSVEVPVDMKIKADIRTPSTGDIPQSVLQGLPDISGPSQTQTVTVDTSQVDSAQTKIDTLNTTVSNIGAQTIVISVTLMSLQSAVTLADRLFRLLTEMPRNIPLSVSYGTLAIAQSRATMLKNELIALTSKTWVVNVDYREKGKRAEGGPVTAGVSYTVGERGPEAFVGRSGNVTMIGVGGQQQRRFSEDGFVIPNDKLATVAPVTRSSRDYEMGGGAPVINIGTINAKSDIDIVKAVKKGIAEAERNRRERS